MRKNIEISDEKISEFLEQFYGYFESGYAFEEFLKVYLETIGLDEVVVTQRSSDGGIDLEAVRYGVGALLGRMLLIILFRQREINQERQFLLKKSGHLEA